MENELNSSAYKGTDRLLFGMILGVLAFWLFAQTMLNINVDMSEDLGVKQSTMNLAVSLTSLFSGIFIVVAGGLADRIGRVKLVLTGFVFSIIGSLLIALTPEGRLGMPVIFAGRVFQGLSGACIMPASLALVKAYWSGAARQRAISLWSMGTWGGAGFCAFVGGLMASNFGWRSIFFATMVVSLAGFLMVKGTPESKGVTKTNYKFDYIGILCFMVAIIAIQIFLLQGGDYGWLSFPSLILLTVFLVSGILFYRIEAGNINAFVNLNLFKNMTYMGATLSNFFLNATSGILLVTLSLVQIAAGLTAEQAGMLTLGYGITVVLFIRVGEKLLQRLGPRKPMLWGSIIVGIAILILLPTYFHIATYKILAMVAFAFFGLGLAFYATPSTDAALTNLPHDQSGAGAGIYKMASSLGAAIGVAISSGVFMMMSGSGSSEWLNGLITLNGRQNNVAVRQAAMMALSLNLLLVVGAIITILSTIPRQQNNNKTI